MKKLLWIAGGIIWVSLAFLMPAVWGENSLWSYVTWGSIGAFCFLLVFSLTWLKQVNSTTKRRLVGAGLVLLFVSSTVGLVIEHHLGETQNQYLNEIRANIETGYARQAINYSLTLILRDYYHPDNTVYDFNTLFRDRYGSDILDNNRLVMGIFNENPTLSAHLIRATTDTLIMVAESNFVEGMDAGFQNISGDTGMFQVRGILTREGVQYERVN